MAPASPSDRKDSDCVFCGVALLGAAAPSFSEALLDRSVCRSCGAPQPISPDADYFAVFGLMRGFRVDRGALEKAFYELSRVLHPDRYAAGKTESWKTISMERMSFLNQAYQALRTPDALREYLMELEGVKSEGEGKAPIPIDLAEEWFELQDAVMEDETSAAEKIEGFEQGLRDRAKGLKQEMERLEASYDASPNREILEQLGKKIQSGAYLKSMNRDVQRLKTQLGI